MRKKYTKRYKKKSYKRRSYKSVFKKQKRKRFTKSVKRIISNETDSKYLINPSV